MSRFRSLSIRSKLSLVIVAASAIGLLALGLALATQELFNLRQTTVRHLSTVADVVGRNLDAALTFEDPETAHSILGSVESEPGVVAGWVYDRDGQPFAEYRRPGLPADPASPNLLSLGGHEFHKDRLTVHRSILVNGQPIGAVLLQSDLREFHDRLHHHARLLGVSLLVSLLVTFGVSSGLQRIVSSPILDLTRVARRVGEHKDFSVRASKRTADEIGTLIDSFNAMLDEIAGRDDALRRSHSELELRVEERTRDLRLEIEERIRIEDELKQTAARAEEANRAKSDFLATMSHEIRTPMNGVIGCTNLLLDTPLSDEQRDYAETIQSSGHSLLNLLNDILDFSKIEAGHLALESVPFPVAAAVEEVFDLLAPQAEARQIELVLHPGLDSLPQGLGDVSRFRQVLLNLVGNAIKFTARGHVALQVGIDHPDHPSPRLRFAIHDTGIGIPRDKISILFHRFQQVDSSTTRRYGGTGLGLAICRCLVERMGGTIGVESVPGRGSTFWFTLPIAPAHAHDEGPAALVHPADLARLRVLVVDDLDINRRVLTTQLHRWHLVCHAAASADEALECLQSAAAAGEPFHIALLDYLMPGTDGATLGARILQDPTLRSTALIMLTSGSQRGDARRFLDAGFAGFLLKPVVRPRQLLDVLAQAWTNHPLRIAPGPSSPPLAPDPSQSPVPSPPTQPNGNHPRRRVLLAEDNPVNQRVGIRMLERLGCRVDVAGNGREAVQMVRRFPYELVFMDCLMPDMDGYESTRAIRQLERQRVGLLHAPSRRLPIVALTANAMTGDRERCLDAGMDDHLAKPVTLAELKKVLDRWEDAARTHDEPPPSLPAPADVRIEPVDKPVDETVPA
ncbi:MAG: response regulator [Verrucomicrobiae bacterium]|nr:response regulator [Verrucomicrobiae bacterium]